VNGTSANVNVGFGTSNPTVGLHVNGTLRVANGTQGIGKVLTSDATDLVSRQALPPFGFGDLSVDVNLKANVVNFRNGIEGAMMQNLAQSFKVQNFRHTPSFSQP
jgi:hypothetical protein